MGASESSMILEQEIDTFKDSLLVESFSSEKCSKVLSLYKLQQQVDEGGDSYYLEENLLNNYTDDTDNKEFYVIVLVNQNNPKYIFNISRFDTLKDAKEKFVELSVNLFPFVEDYPSVQSPVLLMNYIKLKKENPKWKNEKIAQCLNLPEVKINKKLPKPSFNRQKSHQQEETIGLVIKEEPSFARDLLGTLPVQFFSENHPELFESVAATIESIHKTGQNLKESIEGITRYAESPIHVAIRLSQEAVLKMLLEKGVNHLIPCGHAFPAHLAMKHESLGCLKVLLEHDAESVQLQDKKYEGSLLHWVKNTDQIAFLSEFDVIDLDARNNTKETALHIMVKRKRLSPLISLICHGADINAVNDVGETPLHYSAKEDDIDTMKALLVLGSDPSMVDAEGKTPFQHVKESSPDYNDIKELFDMFQYQDKGVPGNLTPSESRTKSVLNEKTGGSLSLLTLDGGGIRGLVLTEILLMVEHFTQRPMYDLFDWISGTSTGSYLASSLSKGRSIRHCQRAYLRLGRTCFTGIRPYSTEMMDRFLIHEFGEDTRMNQLTYPKLLIPAVMADRRPAMLHLFRNFEGPYDRHYTTRDARFPRPPVAADQKLWLAVRSSCSAPSYFRSTGRYLDGGLIANNPTLDAVSEIHKYNQHHSQKEESPLKLVFSIGTGRLPLKVLRPIDLYRPASVWDTPEVVDNLRGFVDLLIDQVAACDFHVSDRANSWCDMIGSKYVRFNPVLQSEIEMNEKDDKILLSMIIEARRFILKQIDELELLAHSLIVSDVN